MGLGSLRKISGVCLYDVFVHFHSAYLSTLAA